jgi:hypothetical protein
MKFSSVADVQMFLLEIGASLNECRHINSHLYEPTNEQLDTFIKSRKPLISSIKNSKKSSDQKYNWLKNRSKLMRGISRFHKSADGKKFHRKLGRFLATRVTEGYENSFYEKNDYLIGLNSLKQHLLIELSYYKPILEAVETEVMIMDYALPLIKDIEESLIHGKLSTDEQLVFVADMVSRKHFLDSLSEISGQSFSKLSDLCESIEKRISEGSKETDANLLFLNTLKKEIYESKK